ncbi:hypothetical protein chiPu_0026572 [Chiloscyllium punctatum]|uniref:Uncharacterized protein n=1 Tax=Chiloscyllium punctatum TaxID=137246 RepID=A0A401TJ37_CHIPU|nr:hypothetical protein [Chiloscyllium punctatum]
MAAWRSPDGRCPRPMGCGGRGPERLTRSDRRLPDPIGWGLSLEGGALAWERRGLARLAIDSRAHQWLTRRVVRRPIARRRLRRSARSANG